MTEAQREAKSERLEASAILKAERAYDTIVNDAMAKLKPFFDAAKALDGDPNRADEMLRLSRRYHVARVLGNALADAGDEARTILREMIKAVWDLNKEFE